MWTWGVWGAPVILDFDAGRALSRVVRSRPTLLDCLACCNIGSLGVGSPSPRIIAVSLVPGLFFRQGSLSYYSLKG